MFAGWRCIDFRFKTNSFEIYILLRQERAIHTGRIVPRRLLEEALEQVPRSVKELGPLVDYHVEVRNAPDSPDVELVTPGETWESFTSRWTQYVFE